MNLTERTITRKMMFAENKLRKTQLDNLCKAIDDIEWNRTLDNNNDATIQLETLKRLRNNHLTSWQQFRTENGLSKISLAGTE